MALHWDGSTYTYTVYPYSLTLGWQYPYSVQHSAYCGHPPTWSMSSALLGKAGQLPWPEPGDTRPCDEANSCTCTCSEEAGPRGGS